MQVFNVRYGQTRNSVSTLMATTGPAFSRSRSASFGVFNYFKKFDEIMV
jgi:hypothetical protein